MIVSFSTTVFPFRTTRTLPSSLFITRWLITASSKTTVFSPPPWTRAVSSTVTLNISAEPSPTAAVRIRAPVIRVFCSLTPAALIVREPSTISMSRGPYVPGSQITPSSCKLKYRLSPAMPPGFNKRNRFRLRDNTRKICINCGNFAVGFLFLITVVSLT